MDQVLWCRVQQSPDAGLHVFVGQQALSSFGRVGIVAQDGQGVG